MISLSYIPSDDGLFRYLQTTLSGKWKSASVVMAVLLPLIRKESLGRLLIPLRWFGQASRITVWNLLWRKTAMLKMSKYREKTFTIIQQTQDFNGSRSWDNIRLYSESSIKKKFKIIHTNPLMVIRSVRLRERFWMFHPNPYEVTIIYQERVSFMYNMCNVMCRNDNGVSHCHI